MFLQEKFIATIKHPKHIELFLKTNWKTALLQTGTISVIKRYVELLKAHDRYVFVHVEKIPGISYDKEGLQFLAKFVQPHGIVSTKSTLIQLAKKEKLWTIQRLFLVDTDAVETGLQVVQQVAPDALEVMPGIVPDMIERLVQQVNIPIITGGLIQNRDQMIQALKKGAQAVSTGNPLLWKIAETEGLQ
ncbi:glycerol-3-phosphate responsive antiterminator [Anoxybacillus ayderensis]|uniref:glycerol-3-phosphate responsive antiterminator n=1 Tax=Anoxybacillus sp. ST70 TaxID=2864180 RepID=UPI00030F3B4D|nr:glycerol-3-phosphate responsive antiterminator [Anoxybacillus sp. ST70]AXM87756.1 glycerol-3-phosphate responsive antiterminator [Anoxybacillus ayderensis G10]MBW9218487.1 glycerol-3-phosphate responsive antiterminator [Anoxybacillus sp. ST70]THD16235.1 glycerol-3-phosphate responsive antiterminator [Anoxybacillus ayderensis]